MLSEVDLESISAYERYCELKFTARVNNKKVDYRDFGIKEDKHPTILNPKEDDMSVYPGCGEMLFTPYENVRHETLEKYNITAAEYRLIQKKLNCLSFGKCKFCC